MIERKTRPDVGHHLVIAMFFAVLPILSGCRTLHAESRVDPHTIAVYPPGRPPLPDGASPAQMKKARKRAERARCPDRLATDSHDGALNLDCFRFPGDPPDAPTAYVSAMKGKLERNRLAAILMKQSDDVCVQELGRLTANEATVNTALSISTSAFAGAASLVSGDTAQRVLSGLAAVSSASRDHVNAEIYRNTLAPVVARAIEGERDKRAVEIKDNLKEPPDAYVVDQMIRDVNAYHHVCSFYYGLGLVVKAVDRTAFANADTRGDISLQLEDLERRLAIVDREVAAKGTTAERKTVLNQDRAAIAGLRDKLLAKRAGVN